MQCIGNGFGGKTSTHTHEHALRQCISQSISSRLSCSRLWGLNRGDAECYQTQQWFVLGTPQLSGLVGHSERWQPESAKVTAAFAPGPAHFRSCLAKLCSTWWLVRSHKSRVSPTSTRTNTPPTNGSGRADGATLTTAETAFFKGEKKTKRSML